MTPEDETPPPAPDGPGPDSPFADEARPGASAGSAPSLGDRTRPAPGGLRRWLRRARGGPATNAGPATPEERPRGRGRPRGSSARQSAVDDFEDLFISAGTGMGRMLNKPATGRVIAINASVDAVLLDEAIARTALDRVAVQPLVRNRKRFEGVLAVFEMPAVMLLIESNPSEENIDRWTPSLIRAVRRALPLMGPALVKVRKREEQLAQAARDLYAADLGIPEFDETGAMVDPVAYIVRDFLAPIRAMRDGYAGTGPGEPQPAPPEREGVPG